MRKLYGPKPRRLVQIYDRDRSKVLNQKIKILAALSNHANQLLNLPEDLKKAAKDRLKQQLVQLLNDSPDINGFMSAICFIQNGKAPDRDGIPSEVWKHGGLKMTDCLYKLIRKVWALGYTERITKLER